MKKTINLLLILITVVFVISCGRSSGSNVATLTFPADDYAKTEFNARVYAVEPFSLSLTLPDGWSVKKQEAAEDEFKLLSVFSKYNILNEDKVLVGVAGYNKYEVYEGAENEPTAIYNQIALGNDYQFDVRETYKVMNETKTGVTAVTDVYYSAAVNDGKEKRNKGIVSYNKDMSVYVAFEFNQERITDEQLESVAKSIEIKR